VQTSKQLLRCVCVFSLHVGEAASQSASPPNKPLQTRRMLVAAKQRASRQRTALTLRIDVQSDVRLYQPELFFRSVEASQRQADSRRSLCGLFAGPASRSQGCCVQVAGEWRWCAECVWSLWEVECEAIEWCNCLTTSRPPPLCK